MIDSDNGVTRNISVSKAVGRASGGTIELVHHIQCILLRSDCVSIPGLGGFMARHVPARIVSSESLFLPPYRAVAFNADLSLNDGLIVQSYMTAHDLSYPSAYKMVESHVGELREILMNEGRFVLDGIGELRMDFSGKLDFVANEAGVLSPGFYGLNVAKLIEVATDKSEAAEEPDLALATDPVPDKEEKHSYTFTISKKVVDIAVAAVISGVMFLLMSYPVDDMRFSGSLESSFAPQMSFVSDEVISNENASVTVTAVAEANAATNLERETNAGKVDSDDDATAAEVKPGGGYSVVLASAISKKRAQAFVEELKHKGYDGAYVYTKGSMTRVLYKHYANEADAAKAARYFRTETPWKEVWVLNVNGK